MAQKLSNDEILQNMKNQVETWRHQGYSDRSNKASLRRMYKPETHHLINQVFKSPIEQSNAIVNEGEHLKWQPDQFDDIGGGWYEYSHGPYGGQVKLYGTPSDYGINGGRASKLSMNYNGKPLLNYDRGWDTPSGKLELAPEHQDFYDKLLSFLDAYGLDL